jgi:LmbE family N-acetylglucosaminyl deacetylase
MDRSPRPPRATRNAVPEAPDRGEQAVAWTLVREGRSNTTEPWREQALRPFKPVLSGMVGRALARTGSDTTAASSRRSCLVLAPHPDDETLGCGITIMQRVEAATPVHVVVVTDGSTWPPGRDPAENIATRDAELRASCGVLGLPGADLTHLDFPEQELDRAGDDLVDAVADAIRTWEPEDVLTTSVGDPHPDHAALGAATRRAVAGTGARLLVYPVWQWDHPRAWVRTWRASSRPELVRTSGYLDRKRAAVASYRSQLSSDAGGELTGGYGLGPRFLSRFLGAHEMFFPVPRRPTEQ